MTLVLVVNLDRRPDRLQWMVDQLCGIDFVRVSAFDGGSLPPPGPEQQVPNAVVAGHRSHRLCWQMLLDSGQPYALILEDDVIVSRRLAGFLSLPILFPPGADIIRIETMQHPFVRLSKTSLDLPLGLRLHRLLSPDYGTAAYIISAKAAEKLMRGDESLVRQVDLVISPLAHIGVSEPDGLVTYQVVPALAIQGMILFRGKEGVPALSASDLDPDRVKWWPDEEPAAPVRGHWLRDAVRPFVDRYVRQFTTGPIPFDDRG
jgi:glycosyl transferase family 25